MIFPDKKHSVAISPSIVIFTFVFGLSLYFIYQIRDILILLFLAFILMTALRPAVDKLNLKLRVPRAVSILIVYMMFLAALSLLVALVLPPLVSEAIRFLRSFNVPIFQQELQNLRLTFQEFSTLIGQVGNGANLLYSLVSSTFNSVFAFFTTMVMSFYLMFDRPKLHRKVGWFTSDKKYHQMVEDFLNSVEQQLGGWIRGQVILMLLIGVIIYIGLSLFSIPFALPLAIMAGFLEILPNIGPTLSAVPAVILGFVSGGPVLGGAIIVFYLLVQQIENNFIVPKIMQANADVNPLVAILTILIGLKLNGVIGALLAIPFYIILRTLYVMLKQYKIRFF